MPASKKRMRDRTLRTGSSRPVGSVRGSSQHPSPDGSAVERHRDQRADPRVGVLGQEVGEGAVELEARDGDADVDRPGQAGSGGPGALLEGPAEVVGPVGLLPGEALAPEVPVGGRLAVDRPPQVEVPDDGGRAGSRTVLRPRPRAWSGPRGRVPNVSIESDTGWAVPIA